MKVFRIIGRSMVSAFKSILRNFSLSMASILCTIITLILVAVGILLSYNVNKITNNIEKQLTVVVFMQRDTTESEIIVTKDKIKKIANISDIQYKSKNDIKKEIASENDTFSKVMESWEDSNNPLQDSFIITLKDIKNINETVTTIKNLDKVDLVKYGESMISDLISIFDFTKNATVVLVIALVLVTAFLISNTIKITIFSRRREIDIMRLVGTSNIVIKLPFIIEGFLIGILGSIIPILITIFGYTFAYNKIAAINMSNIMNTIKLVDPNEIIYLTSLILLILGAVVGMFGSIKAVRKYLTI